MFELDAYLNKWLLVAGCIFLVMGCSSKPVAPVSRNAGSSSHLSLTDGSIEITYLRGMNSHRFVVAGEDTAARIVSYRDHHLLKEMRIAKDKFSELAKESANILASLERHPAQKASAPCRTPFTLKLKDTHEIRSIEGCRSSEEGAALSKLIKDVEFLMASPQ